LKYSQRRRISGLPSRIVAVQPAFLEGLADVRFGSKAVMCSAQADVRFVPIADISRGKRNFKCGTAGAAFAQPQLTSMALDNRPANEKP
jgi:hypothetical protein